MSDPQALPIWTIYANPSDYPGQYVARLHVLGGPTDRVIVGATLEEVREELPQGLYRIDRHPTDDPVIVECWL